MYLRIRNLCGFLGVLLPWVALFSANLVQPHPSSDWWWSISATYYLSPALVAVLTPASLVLLCYKGYDIWDELVTTLSGLSGLGIVLFPCNVSWLDANTLVGFFQIPMHISHTLHCTFAILFFLMLAINSAFLFTQTGKYGMTSRKKTRNLIYRICGFGMVGVEIVFGLSKLTSMPGYLTMVFEIILLTLFGISWLVKGEAFPFLNDTEEDKARLAALKQQEAAEQKELDINKNN